MTVLKPGVLRLSLIDATTDPCRETSLKRIGRGYLLSEVTIPSSPVCYHHSSSVNPSSFLRCCSLLYDFPLQLPDQCTARTLGPGVGVRHRHTAVCVTGDGQRSDVVEEERVRVAGEIRTRGVVGPSGLGVAHAPALCEKAGTEMIKCGMRDKHGDCHEKRKKVQREIVMVTVVIN